MPTPDWLTNAAAGGLGMLGDVAMGILGAGGQQRTNRQNREMAREQMAFQERMSSTAAQRAVEDYRKAGLNPGLAYDRGASSPTGASATMGDEAGAGIHSAMSARAARAALALNREQLQLTRAQTGKAAAEAQESGVRQAGMTQERLFGLRMQPYQEREAQLNNILMGEMEPGARNEGGYQRILGKGGPAIGTARIFSQIVKDLFGGSSTTINRTINTKK